MWSHEVYSNSNTIGQSDDDVVTYGLLVHQVRKQATKTVTKIIFYKAQKKKKMKGWWWR